MEKLNSHVFLTVLLAGVVICGCQAQQSDSAKISDLLTTRLVQTAREGIVKDNLRLVARSVVAIALTGDMTRDVEKLFQDVVDKYGDCQVPHGIWFSEDHPRRSEVKEVEGAKGAISLEIERGELLADVTNMAAFINAAQTRLVCRGYSDSTPQWCVKDMINTKNIVVYSTNGSLEKVSDTRGWPGKFVYYPTNSRVRTAMKSPVDGNNSIRSESQPTSQPKANIGEGSQK